MKSIVKKLAICSIVGIVQISFCGAIIEASPIHKNDGYRMEQQYDRHDEEQGNDWLPFKWHERRENFSPEHHRMERIEDRDFNDRFSGEHPYRWHDKRGHGFKYHGRWIRDAVFFYDDSDELVSIGFMNNGIFIKIYADGGEERNHESFFLSWMSRILP